MYTLNLEIINSAESDRAIREIVVYIHHFLIINNFFGSFVYATMLCIPYTLISFYICLERHFDSTIVVYTLHSEIINIIRNQLFRAKWIVYTLLFEIFNITDVIVPQKTDSCVYPTI